MVQNKLSGKKANKDSESPFETEESGEEYEVEEIMDKKIKKGTVYYHVKWKGFPIEEASWEPADNLSNCPAKIKAFEEAHKEKNEDKPSKDPPKKRGRKSKSSNGTEEDKVEDEKLGLNKSESVENSKDTTPTNKPSNTAKGKSKARINGSLDKDKVENESQLSISDIEDEASGSKAVKKVKKNSPTSKDEVKKSEADAEETKATRESEPVESKHEPKLENNLSKEASIKGLEYHVTSPDSENSIKWNAPKKDVKIYGTLDQGDKPLQVKGVRPIPEKNDLEILVAWKTRDDGVQPEDSKVMRIDMLKHQHWLPLIEFYESKMKLEKVPNFNPSLLPKV